MARPRRLNAPFDLDALFEPRDYLYFYESLLSEEQTLKEVGFLVQILDLKRPKRILDLACGHGRHANRLAALGHEVTGVDRSAVFLRVARAEADRLRAPVRYLRQDMRRLRLPGRVDRALLLYTSFGYFSDAENLLTLRNVSRALERGGLLCVDIWNRDALMKRLQPCWVWERDGAFLIDRPVFKPTEGRVYCDRVVVRGGRVRRKPFSLRNYNYNELSAALAQAGLKPLRAYGDWQGGELTGDSQRMIVVARKK